MVLSDQGPTSWVSAGQNHLQMPNDSRTPHARRHAIVQKTSLSLNETFVLGCIVTGAHFFLSRKASPDERLSFVRADFETLFPW